MKRILSILLCMTTAFCLFGCKSKGYKPEEVMELLIDQDIPEDSITLNKNAEYSMLTIDDEEYGEAEIRFYNSEKLEQDYLDNIEDFYDKVEFDDDDTTAIATSQSDGVTYEYWIHVEKNCIIFVKQYEMSEIDAYLEYLSKEYHINLNQFDQYLDMSIDELSNTLGFDVSSTFGQFFNFGSMFGGFESSAKQREKAEEMEDLILECYEELSE